MKTTIRKIYAIVIAAAICTSLAACSQKETGNDIGDNSGNASNSPLVNTVGDDGQGDEGDTEEVGDGQESEEDEGAAKDDDVTTSDEESPDSEEEPETDPEGEGKDDEDEDDDEDGQLPEKEEETETSVITPETEQQPVDTEKGDAIAKTAESTVGYDFLFGGESPEEGGFDNSGVIYYALTQNGIHCPRLLRDIREIGTKVSYDELKRGDLVFFMMDDGSDAVFGGVYVGEGKAVMSFSEGIPVKIVDVSVSYYRNIFIKGVRVTG